MQKENARLKSILTEHDISWENGQQESRVSESAQLQPFEKSDQSLDPAEKVTLFRDIFQGRADVYLMQNERLTIQDYEALCPEVNRRTLQRDLKAMLDKGILMSRGATHHQEYQLK